MKTSNKILITIGILATGWILFRSVILSFGVPQIANGKPSPFINLPGETNKIEIGTFTDLSINSQGNVKITVRQGPEAGITGDRSLEDCIKLKNQGSTLQISYNNKSVSAGYLNITLPSIKSIRISYPDNDDRTNNTKIEGFTTDSLDLAISRFKYLIISNCKLKKLRFTGRNTPKQYCNLEIKESNQIENLSMDIQGRGWLQLETAGTETNNFVVSDSIGINTSFQVLKMFKK